MLLWLEISITYSECVSVALGGQHAVRMRYIVICVTPSLPTTGLQYFSIFSLNRLAPNHVYIRRTAQLTSRRCVLNIYSTDILTEYFKRAAHSPVFFSLQDAVYFIILSFLVPVIFTFKYRVC